MIHVVLGKWDDSQKLIIGFTDEQIFGKDKPLNNKGVPRFVAFKRTIMGKNSFGKQTNLHQYMLDNISEELFLEWQNNVSLPEIIVYAYNFKTKQNELFNLRNEKYLDALDIIEASSNIPIFINPKMLNGVPYYDGGSVNAIISPEIIEENYGEISEVFSIWNRKAPNDTLLDLQKIPLSSVLPLAFNYVMKIRMANESVVLEKYQNTLCKLHNINVRNFYTYTQIDSPYDNEPGEKEKDIENGYKKTIKELRSNE